MRDNGIIFNSIFTVICLFSSWFFWKKLNLMLSHIFSCTMIIIPFFLSLYFLNLTLSENYNLVVPLFEWLKSGDLVTEWSLRLDLLTSVMLVVVTSVSSLVHIYSIGYMSHDSHQTRFFAYLSFFTFAMLILVTSNNFLQLFFGWEGVGLASYLLIGFWYKKDTANSAAMKAFVVNRVGDFGFLIGLAILFYYAGSLNFDVIFSLNEQLSLSTFSIFSKEFNVLNTACFFLFMGAMGKSAQIFLHTWLPDAMEGPTPVSALIHAATMVTAGIFLVARCSPLFEMSPSILSFITIIGASTAFFAATVALVQNDIKRIVAYSTCSQLGYMFVALGSGAYQIAIFHLFTHAFFKALLFLGSGSVIHAVSDEQDIRKMGGLYKLIPFTWIVMLIGTLGLTGAPLMSGYYSKDGIIEAAFVSQTEGNLYAFYLLVLSALLTSFYSWRLIFLTFNGKSNIPTEIFSKIHESPKVMLFPLFILSIFTIFSGVYFVDYFMYHDYQYLWQSSIYLSENNHVIESIHYVPKWVKYSPLVMMVIGLITAVIFYLLYPKVPKFLSSQFNPVYKFLLNKWYFDEIYEFIFVRNISRIGNFLSNFGDKRIIDGLGPDGISLRVMDIAKQISRIQTGYIYHYAFAMLIGLMLFITYFFIRV
ncbi:MAG: NADH:ubiquinone oxidoreductase subunit L [Candidatus Dadabacteria bacterium]|nr:MAG: NADH:ubiquinone oxidoreductase subunit L [Candidatus Dadabacteria bacterium]